VATLAHAHGATMVVDSTFTSPYLLQPCVTALTSSSTARPSLSAAMAMSRAASSRPAAHRPKLELVGVSLVGSSAPRGVSDARGLKTLPLRVRQQCQNAMTLAEWLADHPRIRAVYYPAEQHPGHHIARRMLRQDCFGSVLSFELSMVIGSGCSPFQWPAVVFAATTWVISTPNYSILPCLPIAY
jgi:cystathionine beta-lyase/cystathionine gamma-synthase